MRPGRLPVQWWLSLTCVCLLAAAGALLPGCGGLPPENGNQEGAGAVVVLVVEQGTGNPLPVPATVIVGGVRGVLNPTDQQLVLRDVPAGTGTPPTQPLTVTAPGYVTHAEPVLINVTTATWVQVELVRADTSVTGTIAGVVRALGTGAGVANAFLQFTPEGQPDAEPVAGFTDNEGRFIIGGIPMGANQLVVHAAGYLEHTERVIIIADDDGTTPDLEVTLIGGDTQVEVRGQVLDVLTRLPIEGATVTIGDLPPAVTGSDGRFAIPGVLVGDHQFEVTHPDYDPYRVTITVMPGMTNLVVELFERAQQPPPGPYTITGTVVITGAADNSGALVTATPIGQTAPMATYTTGPSGEYGLFVPPGRYQVTVSYQGRQISREVTVPLGGVVVTGINFAIAAD